MRFLQAARKDGDKILALYREAVGSEGCTWSEDYPNEETLEDDFDRNALYCLEDERGEIIGALSIDEDPKVDALPNWSFRKEDGVKAAEIARLVIGEKYRDRKLAGKMFDCMIEKLKEMDYQYVYFMVSQSHERAIHAYKELGFTDRGEAELFDEKWFCYEKNLIE